MSQGEMEWNVAPMVQGISAPEVKEKLVYFSKEVEEKLQHDIKQLASISSEDLAKILQEHEKLNVEVRDVLSYCNLRYTVGTTDKENAQLKSWADKAASRISAANTVFSIKLGEVLLERPELINDSKLSNYQHYLEKIRKSAPYRLSEVEERLIAAKDVNGISLLSKLQESWVSSRVFEIEVDGEKREVPLPVLSSMRQDTKRPVREMASRTLYKSYSDAKLIHATALHGICADHVEMTERRGMPSTMTQSLLAQDVDEATIESLLEAIESTSKIYQDFLKLKAKYMDLEKLKGSDVIAPWVAESVWSFKYADARKIVIDSFASFDEEMGMVVKSMFEDSRIDALSRVGKANTAFCAGWPSAKKSFIMMTYAETLGDVFTLAHENGHAAQGHLIYNSQTPLNYSAGMCMAETGSIFGELLLTDKMLGMSENDEQRFEVLSHTLGDFYYTVYYVGMRALFEKELYKVIERGDHIDSEIACDLWRKSRDRIFGDAVEWSECMEYEWARIPHFFFANYRFYNYPYSFAQMLVYAIYEEYKSGEGDFNLRFKKLLSSGGSKSPREQIAEFGHDLTDPQFWELGPKQADRLLSELKKTI